MLIYLFPSPPCLRLTGGGELKLRKQGSRARGRSRGGQNLLPRLNTPCGHDPGAIRGHPEPPSVLLLSWPGLAAWPGHSQGPLITGPLQAAFSSSLSVSSFQKKWKFKASGRAGLSARFHKDLGIQRNEGRGQLEPRGGAGRDGGLWRGRWESKGCRWWSSKDAAISNRSSTCSCRGDLGTLSLMDL